MSSNSPWIVVLGFISSIITLLGVLGFIWWLARPRVEQFLEQRFTAAHADSMVEITQRMEALEQPLSEVHTATTVNSHSDPERPTLRDDLDDVKGGLSVLAAAFSTLQGSVSEGIEQHEQTREWIERHTNWSVEETSRLWGHIKALEPPKPVSDSSEPTPAPHYEDMGD